MTKTARVYKIEMLIRNRGHVSFQALLDELEVSPATLKRDLDYLKDQLGAPIEYDRFLNGYRFGEEYPRPEARAAGLWFSERELYSLLMAHQLLSELDSEGVISRHLQPLLDRIHQMLGTGEADAKALLKRVKIIGSAKRPVSSQFFELVGEALLKRRRFTCATSRVGAARSASAMCRRSGWSTTGTPGTSTPGATPARSCCASRSTPSSTRPH
jgi:predicted DNA-binding transcriptional regulator YafY